MSRRLTLVIHSLDGGGAERTAARMANDWARAGHAVTLITLDTPTTDRYPLSGAVARRGLGVMRNSSGLGSAVINNWRRLVAMRRAIVASAPEYVISFTDKTNVLVLAASRGLRIPVVVAERTDPRFNPIGQVWAFLRRLLYPLATAIVVQTDAARRVVCAMAPRGPIYVIPNVVEKADTAPRPAWSIEKTRRRLIAVGRLVPSNGFDLCIEAFSRVAPTRPDWELILLGEGPERPVLERLAHQRGLADRVRMPGWTDAPSAAMSEADVFVLSSRYEGFPNALLEAMTVGLPCVSFDCPSGPSDIVRDGYDGLLVPPEDVERLAESMARLMDDAPLRQQLAKHAPEVLERFNPRCYYARWDAVLSGRPPDDPVFQ